MKDKNKPHSIFQESKIWANNSNSLWLASTINFSRNMERYKFPGKLESERSKQVVSFLSSEFLKMPDLDHPKLLKADDLDAVQKEFLVEHFLTPQSFQHEYSDEAFILEESGVFMATLNMRNHVQLELIDTAGDLENTWNKLVNIEAALGKVVSYSYSPKFGFLTADPTQCGTAMTATVFLQLSGLIHLEQIDDVLEKLADDNLDIRGIQGSPTEIIGDVLVVQNNYTLGLTEEAIIANLRNFTTKILVEEHACRNKIKQDQSPHIKDKISRAYGIIAHSYQIEAIESLNAISLLKLGVELGWVVGVTMAELNQLFFNSRRAHLLCQLDEKIPQDEIPHKRAEFIHAALKGMQLTI